MADSTAHVTWNGSLMEGAGTITSVGSGMSLLSSFPVSWASRTGEKGGQTTPEELIAAAHASCFSMALSHGLAEAGTPPEALDVDATVTFVRGHGHHEDRTAGRRRRPGPRRDRVRRGGGGRGPVNCPVSKALAAVPEILGRGVARLARR